MASVGNSVAAYRNEELAQLRDTLKTLESLQSSQPPTTQISPHNASNAFAVPPFEDLQPGGSLEAMQSDAEYMSTHSFDMEDVLSSEQLEAVANAMNLNGLDWTWAASSMDQLDPSLL